MVLPQQQARNPPSIREASEDKQIHRFLHISNEKVRNLMRFTCNPMESDAEKEEIERGIEITCLCTIRAAKLMLQIKK